MNAIFTCLILIGLIALGSWLFQKFEYKSPEWLSFAGIIMSVASGVLLFIHIIILLTVGYEYNSFAAKRKAFETTLNDARNSNNQYEAAAITRDIVMWNAELASMKYTNSTFLLGQYVDDRVEDLDPIK